MGVLLIGSLMLLWAKIAVFFLLLGLSCVWGLHPWLAEGSVVVLLKLL
jgi:hypothetical protein